MRQRGRKSAANLIAMPAVDGKPARVSPPTHLTARERKAFIELVASTDAKHFIASDVPLLVTYIQSIVLVRDAARKKDAQSFEKLSRVSAMLATRLRLSPHARTDPKVIARAHQEPRHPTPWND